MSFFYCKTRCGAIKYTTNTFLATKVSFANEIYEICERLDIDYDKVEKWKNLQSVQAVDCIASKISHKWIVLHSLKLRTDNHVIVEKLE